MHDEKNADTTTGADAAPVVAVPVNVSVSAVVIRKDGRREELDLTVREED